LSVNVVQSRAGELMAGVLRDAAAFEHALRIPVTLPPADPRAAKSRVTACVFLGSERDASVAERLGQIFPGLNVWSAVPIHVGASRVTGHTVQAKVVAVDSPAFRQHLAATTLALDLGGTVAGLPALAAEMMVPCVGPRRVQVQDALWPGLSLDDCDADRAAALCRRILTDQGAAAECCALAARRLEARGASLVEARIR
jgi:hypothetical protein